MIESILNRIIGSRYARYYLNRISNLPAFDPVFNVLVTRVSIGFRRLAELGLNPGLVVDVGANVGDWTLEHLSVFPRAKFVMVEAQPMLTSSLESVVTKSNGRARFVISMLGAAPAEAIPFYLTGTGSSRFEEMTSFARQAISLPMTTLDLVLGDVSKESVLLKMDVQGGELDVLAGAQSTLRNVDVILMEASIVAYNAGAPRFAEVVAEMDRIGFRLFDIWDLRRIGKVLAQSDLVFVRKGGKFEDIAQRIVRDYGKTSTEASGKS